MEGLVMTTRALLGGAAILAIASVPPTIADAQSASPQKSSASCEVVSKLSFKGTMAQRRAESTEDWPAPPTAREGAPNVLVWVIDDAGFAHLGAFGGLIDTPVLDQLARSEEHTSELQSLMRISYAVFCLKKKTSLKQ